MAKVRLVIDVDASVVQELDRLAVLLDDPRAKVVRMCIREGLATIAGAGRVEYTLPASWSKPAANMHTPPPPAPVAPTPTKDPIYPGGELSRDRYARLSTEAKIQYCKDTADLLADMDDGE